MEQDMENLVTQIKRIFTYGGMYEYLRTTQNPDIEIVGEYLEAIERGDDLYHRNEEAQVKAYILLQKLSMLKQSNHLFFSR